MLRRIGLSFHKSKLNSLLEANRIVKNLNLQLQKKNVIMRMSIYEKENINKENFPSRFSYQRIKDLDEVSMHLTSSCSLIKSIASSIVFNGAKEISVNGILFDFLKYAPFQKGDGKEKKFV
ncbi:uncharacterized protein LOC136087454 [Hydra vulgaris]|uniref:Uncharacterized protein LOC136087454 n=1 Tax=Hydra vulgaris TaxID=6087 RepID=A0ABM4CWI4_HYDVU